MNDLPVESAIHGPHPRVGGWLPVVCIAGGLIAWSFLRVPIPGVNEPHYLAKAKHWWDSSWCAGDIFLESSNPHLVYYVTFGWLTRFLSLETTAAVIRVVCLGLVAIGWQTLGQSVLKSRWSGVVALPVFLLLHSLGNWSGEWLIGGTESKVPAYGFLFWGLGTLLQGKTILSALLMGLAVCFHPIVGCWGIVAAGLTVLIRGVPEQFGERAEAKSPFPWKRVGIASVVLAVASLPGVLPALSALGGAAREEVLAATHLQVAYRLAHHLDPMKFPKESYRYFGMMILLWVIITRSQVRSPEQKWWHGVVIASIVIGLIGVAIGFGPRPVKTMPGWEWRISLLKFYPFRLSDLFVPIALSFACVRPLLARSCENDESHGNRWLVPIGLTVTYIASVFVPGSDQNPSRMDDQRHANWVAVCKWIDENTNSKDMVYGIDDQWALKWYSHRPEYVNYKDCPQDPRSLLEWNRRRWVIAQFQRDAMANGSVSPQELKNLANETGIRYLITRRFGPILSLSVFQVGDYKVFKLPPPSPAAVELSGTI